MKQPDALLLAEKLEQQFPLGTAQHYLDGEAAAELRRLHAENKRLETLCYDYLGELTAMRAVEHMRKQTFMAEYKFRTYGYYQDADGKMQVGEIPEEMLTVSVEELIEKAVLAEREACADIAENWRCNGCPRTVLADQIRARGQE
jgi:hypothetical protein